MANEDARQFIANQITGLRITVQELTRIHLSTGDLNLADRLRSKITDINQTIFALESAFNSLNAAIVVPPPSPERIAILTAALRQLDAFVRSDQNIQQAISFLTQLADQISTA